MLVVGIVDIGVVVIGVVVLGVIGVVLIGVIIIGVIRVGVILIGVIAGVILGVILRASKEDEWSKREAMYVSFVGKLFLSALKSIIIPLVIPSLIIAIGTLDISLSGKIGGRAVAYYMSTTMVRIFCLRPNKGFYHKSFLT